MANGVASLGHPCCVLSNESSAEELMRRMIANRANIPTNVITKGRWHNRPLNKGEMVAITKATHEIKDLPIHWHRFKKATRSELEKTVRLMVKKGVKTFFLDYLQNFQPNDSSEARSGFKKAVVDPICDTISELKRTYGATFFVYGQLNKEAEGIPLSKLTMGHIRDTTKPRDDADTMAFILNGFDNQENKEDAGMGKPKERRLYFMKGRDTGSNQYIDFHLHGAYARFEYLEK